MNWTTSELKTLRQLYEADKDPYGRVRRLSKALRRSYASVSHGVHVLRKMGDIAPASYNVRIASHEYSTARQNGINKKTLHTRIRLGWDMQTAVTKPVRNAEGG